MLRDGPWVSQPFPVDRTTIRRPTPEAFRPAITEATIDVLPLLKQVDAKFRPGWCTYADAFDSPETEVLCGGINHKTPTAAAIWRQGNLLHFGFDLSPEDMNERGQQLLVNSIVYIARFTEDRPITLAPERALLRVGADRIMAKATPQKEYLEWYFTAATREKGKAGDWPAFQAWYKQHRDYLRAERGEKGSLVLDEEAESLGVPPNRSDFVRTMIGAIQEGGQKAEKARSLLRRYVPSGPQDAKAESWQAWWDENRQYLFFSESGWYRWYLDPLAKQRGVPTASLRGPARGTAPH